MTDHPATGTRRTLTGWGRTAPSVATVVRPGFARDIATTADAGRATSGRGAIARGLGRAYGDAAQNGGGTVFDCTALDTIGPVDATQGTIAVGGGADLAAIALAAARAGWRLPVVPGTQHVTVGGAIAADIHGKGHHRDGAFGAHLESCTLQVPGQDPRYVTRESDPALFAATTGGMGLTGVIVAATLRLEPFTSPLVRVETARTRHLDATMDALIQADARHRYSVAWIDLAGGRGRGIVEGADHLAAGEAASGRQRRAPLRPRSAGGLTVPPLPVSLIRTATVRMFNAAWYARPRPRERLQAFEAYNAPLDALGAWPRLYGPRGLLQYQCALPDGAERTLHTVAEAIEEAPVVAGLAVLKRLGAASGAPLSFPIAGWTLAVDFPAGDAALRTLLDTLDRRVAEAGGRVYLAKDARMRAEMMPLMYPRIDEWRETQARADPRGALTSDLDRRLRLTARSAR